MTDGAPESPYETRGDEANMVALMDDGSHTWPEPAVQRDSVIAFASDTIADLSISGVQSGCIWRRSAAAPLTWGVAMEVPLSTAYPEDELIVASEKGTVERMSTPGADISGFTAICAVGPLELKDASSPAPSTAPTVIALSARPGVLTVPMDGPEFPAATTTVTPAAVARSTAWHTGSSTSPSPPRLMLMMSA